MNGEERAFRGYLPEKSNFNFFSTFGERASLLTSFFKDFLTFHNLVKIRKNSTIPQHQMKNVMAMNSPFCPKCGAFLQPKRGKDGKIAAKCPNPKCNWLATITTTKSFTFRHKIQHSPHQKTIIKDSIKEMEELRKKFGDIKVGWACPKCKSFYLTRELVSTRGDEPGKIYTHCLACGHVFKRARWLDLRKHHDND